MKKRMESPARSRLNQKASLLFGEKENENENENAGLLERITYLSGDGLDWQYKNGILIQSAFISSFSPLLSSSLSSLQGRKRNRK